VLFTGVIIFLVACEPSPLGLTAFPTITPTVAFPLSVNDEGKSSAAPLFDGEVEQQTATPIPASVNLTPLPPLQPGYTGLASLGEGELQEPGPTLAPLPSPDYQPMVETINRLIARQKYQVGVAFVDIRTMQVFSFGGSQRFHAMSTFKGPLAVYYLWLLERGQIAEKPGDENRMKRMLDWSSNRDTTCIFKRVGGIASFNDWLATQGFRPEYSFIEAWNSWICVENGLGYAPESDLRFRATNTTLLKCGDRRLPCDKGMSPTDLALFYARVARGDVINSGSLARWLSWMEKKDLQITSMFDALPEDAEGTVHAYTKNGFYAADSKYAINIYHEAGILDTPEGAFALAVFMQGNPEWRGTDIHGEIGRVAYDAFIRAHRGGQ
jgi:beta-lactamase class A